MAEKSFNLRNLPSVDQLLRSQEPTRITDFGIERLTALARRVIAEMRRELSNGGTSGETTREALLAEATERLDKAFESASLAGIRRVINATGVILHTNLGRAPLSTEARAAVWDASGYCTLEYDAATGLRGKRGRRVEELLKQLTHAEDAIVVNNCASAALLVLTALAHEGDTLVSRGELVEIGGDFRVPDVLANSGTRMVEVGTTNRTRLEDYRSALTDRTQLLMRIHPSNYRIIGFTSSPATAELAALAHHANLPLYEDAGSGVLRDLSETGLKDEPVIHESIETGVDVVSFSGDKLLGASQAGILVGKHAIIDRLRKHSLYRALRADKLCLAALEATLEAHARGTALTDVPTLRMLAMPPADIEERAKKLVHDLRGEHSDLSVDLVPGQSAVGGGSGPNTHPATTLISLVHRHLSAESIEMKLRQFSPPIVGRISEGKVLLDLRTVESADETELRRALQSLG